MSIIRDDERATLEFQNGPQLPPIHPGEALNEEFLIPMGISISRLASDLGVSYPRMHEVVSGKRSITAETALLLAKYFGTSAAFWLNLQSHYDLMLTRPKIESKLKRVRPIETVA